MVVASLLDSLAKIGAVGGIIAFVGVGLLILLLASQARQIREMKDWIDGEPERQAETAQRVITEVQRRIAAARERRAAVASGQPLPPARPLPPMPGTLGDTPEARAAAAVRDPDSISSLPEGSVPPPGDGPQFAPLTPAGEAAELADASIAPPIADVLGQATQPSDPIDEEYDPLSASTAYAQDPDFVDGGHFDLYDDEEEPRGNRVLFGVGAATLIAGIVLFGVLLFGGGGDKKASTKADSGAKTTKKAAPTTPDVASISVSVLNTTAITGLARNYSDQLKSAGYNVDAPDSLTPSRQNSVVEYRSGHEADAQTVAAELNLGSGAVSPIESTVAQTGSPDADVIVVVGEDLATDGATGTQG